MPNARVDAAVRVFFADAINTYISRLSKADRPPQRRWAACDPQRTEKSEVPRGRGDSARSRRRSRPTRSIAPSWVCGLSSASPADFALARPHMCTSQFLRTFLSLSLCIYTSMQTTHWLCFSGEPCCQTCPHRASHRYSASLRARETSDHRHGRTGPNVNALWAPSHSQLTPRPTRQTPAGGSPLQGRRLWRKTALHDTCSSPWPEPGGSGRELLLHHQLRPKAETRVLGLGQGDRHGEQLGRCWGHKGRIILRGTELINGTFMRPPRRTQATHPHGMAI